MKIRRTGAAIGLAAILLSNQAAQAADAVYLGDCERARQVQLQSTIDTLVPHRRYEGVQRAQFGINKSSACDLNSLIVNTLTERSRSTSAVVYDMVRNDVFYGKQSGCSNVHVHDTTWTGTVTFTTVLSERGELCELYIKADWFHTGPNKMTDFWNRVISMDNGAFVISQPAASGGEFRTPLAFTGID
jgi:hypothetical protein